MTTSKEMLIELLDCFAAMLAMTEERPKLFTPIRHCEEP